MDKKEIINEIERVVNSGDISNGKILADEYIKNFNIDPEIASIKAVISFFEGNFDESLAVIRKGLMCDLYNSDLYSIMGNVYEQKQEYNNALICYYKAYDLCNIEENKKVLSDNIMNIKTNYNTIVSNISFIIVAQNNLDYLKQCIDSIRKNLCKERYEIVVVDNNSNKETLDYLKTQEDIITKYNKEKIGYSEAVNEGIEASCKDNDIFLLDSSAVIMPNSIFNMQMGLYKNNDIVAAGAVSNLFDNNKLIINKNMTPEEYLKFICENNIYDDKRHDMSSRLSGFAMLIKRKALNETGLFDAKYLHKDYACDDFSFRLIINNYKLVICKDSLIHNCNIDKKANKDGLIDISRNNFIEKWGIERDKEIHIIDISELNLKDYVVNILEINSNTCDNLVEIDNRYPGKNIYSTSGKDIKNELMKSLGINVVYNLEDEKYKKFFDCIIITDKDIFDDNELMKKLTESLLNDNGMIVAAFNNDNKIKLVNIKEKLHKNRLLLTFINNERGVNTNYYLLTCRLVNEELVEAMLSYYFEHGELTRAEGILSILKSFDIYDGIDDIKKKYSSKIEFLENIKFMLRRADLKDEDISNDIFIMIDNSEFNDEAIVKIIEQNMINKVKVYNLAALKFFEIKKYDRVLPYLNAALKINAEDLDTIMNMGYVLNYLGEKEKAVSFLEKYKNKNDEVNKLISEIKGVN